MYESKRKALIHKLKTKFRSYPTTAISLPRFIAELSLEEACSKKMLLEILDDFAHVDIIEITNNTLVSLQAQAYVEINKVIDDKLELKN